VRRAERGTRGQAEDEVVDVLRPPPWRRELGALLLREGEVGVLTLSAVARERSSAVEQPVQESEDETVAEPDQGTGREQRGRRVGHLPSDDQVSDQDGGREQRHHDERKDEADRDR